MKRLGWVALSFSLLMNVSACSAGAVCSPSTCQFGCCDAQGACVTSTNDAQCGLKGEQCHACGAAALCQLGVCTATGFLGGTGGGSGGGTAGGVAGGSALGGGNASGGGGVMPDAGPITPEQVCNELGLASVAFQIPPQQCGVAPRFTDHCLSAANGCSTTDLGELRSIASCLRMAPPCDASQYMTCVGVSGVSPGCYDRFLDPFDAGAPRCPLLPDLRTLSPSLGHGAYLFINDAGVTTSMAAVSQVFAGNPNTVLVMEAVPWTGVFAGSPVMPGMWSQAPGTVWMNNGLQVTVQEYDPASQQQVLLYVMSGGTISLTLVPLRDGDLFSGSVSNARFMHADLTHGAPIPDGCTTSLTRFDFSYPTRLASP